MDKTYDPSKFEPALYKSWEEQGLFKAKVNPQKKPFSIILPPPNANGYLHIGHAMYVYEDIMIRYKKLAGFETLWLPGADHAGIETQYVFEKHLNKQGKSRFDYDRDTLFKMIWEYVEENRGVMEAQLRRLGFALDWSRQKYTLDTDIVAIVCKSFKKLYDEGLVYRSYRLVNYCTRDGTSFADLEVVNSEVEGKLYYIKYLLKEPSSAKASGGKGKFVTVATTRPETLLGDAAVAVNPKDKRYKDLVGKTVILPLAARQIPIIADSYVDMKFGTGALKITPSHDFNDFEVSARHKLSAAAVIGFDGKMQNAGQFDGLKVKAAREAVVEKLESEGLLEKVEPHPMTQKICYRCSNVLEPLPMEQWYINVKPLVASSKKLLAPSPRGDIVVYPKRFKKVLTQILDNYIDWNISRQNVWGIRIPAYLCQEPRTKNQEQARWFVSVEKPDKCQICGECDFEQDPDTFDTWFSSSQWPFATLRTFGREFYEYFYPTSVMETGYDILRAWVARMIMMGHKITGSVPFGVVFSHGLVRDKKGAKMSKSRGNVVDPMEKINQYGADAFRASLLFNVQEGADLSFSEERIIGMRNFANKIWNIGRFLEMSRTPSPSPTSAVEDGRRDLPAGRQETAEVKKMAKEFEEVKKAYLKHMEKYEFSKALGVLHEAIWHRLADYYVEELKIELRNGNIKVWEALKGVYLECLQMLHPFMPFVTEAVWQVFEGKKSSILNSKLQAPNNK